MMPKNLLKNLLVLATFSFSTYANAQVTGGQHSFEYLRLSNSAHLTALGGLSVANPVADISLAMQNPALLRAAMHNQLSLTYNAYYADISAANMAYGYHLPKTNTNILLGVQYLNYGSFDATDAAGNVYGTFQANDFALTLGASRSYLERWQYGAAVKFAHSNLYDRKASALLADVGVTYTDTANLLTVGIVAKNMGATVEQYNYDNGGEPLPFDLQIGISKRFAHLPLRVMATLHHLYEWDIRYNNPADLNSGNLFGSADTLDKKSHFADKLFRHVNLAAEISLGKRITATVGYNHLRRGELGLKEKMGAAGFSMGVGLHLNKFDVYYGRSWYHIAGAYNEFTLNMALNKIVGLGKGGKKINWNAEYEDELR